PRLGADPRHDGGGDTRRGYPFRGALRYGSAEGARGRGAAPAGPAESHPKRRRCDARRARSPPRHHRRDEPLGGRGRARVGDGSRPGRAEVARREYFRSFRDDQGDWARRRSCHQPDDRASFGRQARLRRQPRGGHGFLPRAAGSGRIKIVTNANESFVYVIDDDEAVRDSLTMLLESAGLACEAFASAFDFLEAYDPERLACIVSDIRMPGMNGLELQERMLESGI